MTLAARPLNSPPQKWGYDGACPAHGVCAIANISNMRGADDEIRF